MYCCIVFGKCWTNADCAIRAPGSLQYYWLVLCNSFNIINREDSRRVQYRTLVCIVTFVIILEDSCLESVEWGWCLEVIAIWKIPLVAHCNTVQVSAVLTSHYRHRKLRSCSPPDLHDSGSVCVPRRSLWDFKLWDVQFCWFRSDGLGVHCGQQANHAVVCFC